MTSPEATTTEVAAETWRLLLGCAMARFGKATQIAQELGLTPGHVKALLVLDPEEPQTMGDLASALGCDASTVTWLVDRLEERSLVERLSSKDDRRVKTIALTRDGKRMKEQLQRRIYDPPPPLLDLSDSTIRKLHDVVAQVSEAISGEHGHRMPFPASR